MSEEKRDNLITNESLIEDNGNVSEESVVDEYIDDIQLNKELRKFNVNYNRSIKNSIANDNTLKEIDEKFLKKIRIKRAEILSIRKKIDANLKELNDAYETFQSIYNHEITDEIIVDTKDKALAQKTLFYRKSIRDIDLRLEKEEKEYKELLKDKEDEFALYKKSFAQTIYDLERRKKGEIQKGKKAKADEIASLNEMLSETNDRTRINAINEHLNTIKKEALEGSKEINEKYLNLRRDEDLKNIANTLEYENSLIEIDKKYEELKNELTFQKKKNELNYEIESKTYILAAKRANNNLKKDLIIKKNGVLVNTYDSNKNLYERLVVSSIELLDLQKTYNKTVLNTILKELNDRTQLVLSKIKYVANNIKIEEESFEETANGAFIKSLFYYNELTMKNLKNVVKSEMNEVTNYIRAAYDANARADYKYSNINDKVKSYFETYKKECNDQVNQLFNNCNKETKDSLKYSQINNVLTTLAQNRLDEYKKLMEEVNHTIISFATGSDNYTLKYSDDDKTKEMLFDERSKYFTNDYKTAEEELKAIEVIHKEEEILIDEEYVSFQKESDEKKKALDEEIEQASKALEEAITSRIEAINDKYNSDEKAINEAFNENLKSLTGAYKTENKLIKD